MKLYNGTQQDLHYTIRGENSVDCGTIIANGVADWPGYDNQENVNVSFSPPGESTLFKYDVGTTVKDETLKLSLVVQ